MDFGRPVNVLKSSRRLSRGYSGRRQIITDEVVARRSSQSQLRFCVGQRTHTQDFSMICQRNKSAVKPKVANISSVVGTRSVVANISYGVCSRTVVANVSCAVFM